MNFLVELIDGTFDLLADINSVSMYDNELDFHSDKFHYGYSYHSDLILSYRTITYKEYEKLFYSTDCNNSKINNVKANTNCN